MNIKYRLRSNLLLVTLLALVSDASIQAAPQAWKEFFSELRNAAKMAATPNDESHTKQIEKFGRQNELTSDLTTQEIYQRLLKSTVWIRTNDSQATGWILDKEKGLIITNHHVVQGSESVSVFPPKFEDGELITDESEYARYTRPFNGVVIDSEVSKDLALIKVNTPLPKTTASMKLARKSASPAERIHVIGGLPRGSQGMFVYANGHVRQVSKGHGAMPGEVWLIQMTVPINYGNSGGAIVNDKAELVGVATSGFLDAEDVTFGTDFREVTAYIDTIKRLYPSKSANDDYEIGVRHYRANRLNSAARHFTSALKAKPNMAAAYRMRGFTYRLKKDLELAMTDFNSALQLNSSDAVAFHGRGLVQQSLGDLEKAKADVSEAIRLDPTLELAHYDRGIIHWSLKKYDEAAKDYSRTVELNEYNYNAFLSRGLIHLHKGSNQDALKDFERSVAIWPTSVGYNNIGVAHFRLKNNQLAINNYARATKLDPKNSMAWENLGEVFYFQKRYDDSISHAAYALSINPSSGRALYIRAQAELSGGNKHHALNDVNKAIRLYPKTADYYVLRSQINHSMGDTDAAEKDFRTAAKLDPRYNTHTVAKPTMPDQNNIQGSWRVQTTIRGVKYNSVIRFSGNQYFFTSNWVDVNGTHGQTKGNGTFSTANGTMKMRDSRGRVTNHNIGFTDGSLSLQFPGMNTTDSVWLYKSR